jgi:hypothetical protein
VIDPLPEPLLGLATTTQLSGLAAIHAHVEADAVIVTTPLPPSAGGVAPGGAIENAQDGGGAD